MFLKKLTIWLYIIFLVISCSIDNQEITIKIMTGALGEQEQKIPEDIIELWDALDIKGEEIYPKIEIIRIDLTEEQLYPEPYDVPTFGAEQAVKLSEGHEVLKEQKVPNLFSINGGTSDIKIAKERIAKIQKKENIFYLKSNIANTNSFSTVAELLEALKQKIAHSDAQPQEYVIVYNINDEKIADKTKSDKEIADKIKADAIKADKTKAEADKAAADKLTADKIKADAIKADKEAADKANAKAKVDAELKIKQEADAKAKQEKYKVADTTIPITPIENTTTSAEEEVRPEPKPDIKLYSLIVNTEPRSANIKISGRKYYSGTKLAEGKYQIRVSKKGYFSQSITVNLTKDKAVSINLVEKPVSQKPPENSSTSSDSGSPPQRPVEPTSSSCSQQLNKIRSYVGKDIKAANDGLIQLSIFDIHHAAKCTASDRAVSDELREQLQQQKN